MRTAFAGLQMPLPFLQGTRDELAHLRLLQPLLERLGARATLALFADADHSFHVPKRSGRTDAQVIVDLADAPRLAWKDSQPMA
ncbi:MAG: alpha/beta family hydrolase [Rudaea sp.]